MKTATRVLLLLFLVVPTMVRAEEPARFLIERIDVRHLVHVSPDVIRSESRLHEGQSVTEGELRDANSRIKRLPFVLDATFSLERGSARDAYVLVIVVNETRPLFYLTELVPYARSRNVITDADVAAVLGGRVFAGRSGAFHLALIAPERQRPFEADYYTTVQAGYTRYGLFGGRAFATLTINHYLVHHEHVATLPGGVIGVALAPNQTLTISYTAVDVHSRTSHRSERTLESRLAYDTTNHPFFPTNGSLLTIAPILAWSDFSGFQFDGAPYGQHSTTAGLQSNVAHYWPFDDRLSLGAISEGGVVHVSPRGTAADAFSRTVFYGSATLRLSRAIGDINYSSDSARRFELSVRVVSKERVYAYSPELRDSATQVSLSWVRRDAWGVLRLGLGYSW